MRHRCLVFVFTFLIFTGSRAQVKIDSIIIQDQRIVALPFNSNYSRPDTSLVSTIDFLSDIAPGQLQRSTPGGLTTLLHRGHAHRHIPILWQGVNIQNVINGVYDISLIPQFLMGPIDFYSQQSQSPFGNNGLSGALTMENSSSYSDLTLGISTLQNYFVSTHFNKTFKKWQMKLGVESQYAKNIFTYKDKNLKGQRPSTEFKKTDWTLGLDYFLNSKSRLSINHWGQLSKRHIPVSITASPTLQIQEDENFRTQIAYKNIGEKSMWLVSGTAMQEYLNFYTVGVNSKSQLDIYTFRIENRALSSHYSVFFQNRIDKATPNFFIKMQERNTFQWGGHKRIQWYKSIHSFLGLRQDFVDGQLMPLSINHNLYYKNHEINFSYNYNLPGFNDLFWPLGGNENLQTEISKSLEYKYKDSLNSLVFEAVLFGQLTDNWIQWLPSDRGFWTADNQKKVFSRGGDIRLNYPFTIKKLNLSLGLAYALNMATIKDHESNKNLIGKQLIFVPRHKTLLNFKINNLKHAFHLDYTWTGRRYDLQDEGSYLKDFHWVNAEYILTFKKSKLGLKINNLTNGAYSLVRFFPMPGIHSEIIYQYIFN